MCGWVCALTSRSNREILKTEFYIEYPAYRRFLPRRRLRKGEVSLELEILRWIQQFANPFWDFFFETLSFLGEPLILVSIFCYIYWCLDKKRGLFLGYSVVMSLVLNGFIKDFFDFERPIGKPGIISRRLDTATGSSFPSGHTQSTAAFWTSLALSFRRRALWAAAAVLIAGVGLSRLYLGVHYPKDVLAGLVLGLLSSLILWSLYRRWGGRISLYLVSAAVFLPALFFEHNADFYKAFGLLLGVTAGIYLERRWVRFSPPVGTGRRIRRWAAGLLGLGIAAGILKLLLSASTPFLVLRYSIIGFLAVGGCPWLLVKLRL